MAPGSSRSSSGVLLGVFLLALGLRLAYVLAFRASPFFQNLTVDSQWHDEWAWAWAEGHWGDPGQAFFRTPLYPLWLSGIYAVFGHDLTAVRLVQAVLGSVTAVLLAAGGIRWFGRAAGLAAGLLAAAYGPMIFFDGELLIPNLLLFLLGAALFLFTGSPRLRGLALAGLCLGLAAAARPNALILVPAAALWWGWLAGGGGGRRRRGAMVLALGFLPVLTVSALNTAREGAWTGPATQGGVNFYAGNHPGASGRSVEIPELRNILTWRQFEEQAEAVAERDAGRPLGSREVSGWWFRRGLEWVMENPGAAAGLYLWKAYYLANGFEIPSNRDLYADRRGPLRWLLWKTPFLAFPWGVVFPLALAGIAAAWSDPRYRRPALSLGLWVVLYALTILPFFVTARFRMGLLPPLLLLAGFALIRFRHWVRKPAPAAVFLIALLLSNSRLAEVRADNPAQEMARLGETMIREGKNQKAIEVLERSHRSAPRDVVVAGLLAEAYMRESRPREAVPLFRQIADARPGDPEPRFNLGVAYLALEEYEAAANVFETVVRMDATDAAAWVNLGVASEGRYRLERAEEAYSKGIALAPGEELAYLNLARIRAGREDWEGAVGVLSTGAEALPASFDLHVALAAASDQSGNREAAMRAVNRALALDPDRAEAKELKEWLESRP